MIKYQNEDSNLKKINFYFKIYKIQLFYINLINSFKNLTYIINSLNYILKIIN